MEAEENCIVLRRMRSSRPVSSSDVDYIRDTSKQSRLPRCHQSWACCVRVRTYLKLLSLFRFGAGQTSSTAPLAWQFPTNTRVGGGPKLVRSLFLLKSRSTLHSIQRLILEAYRHSLKGNLSINNIHELGGKTRYTASIIISGEHPLVGASRHSAR